ncbi:ATP-binding protein [Acinetobacter beijerinckii]|uniref:ATP-binding protein n=1 Tax=Acinetobacter beijerinckii TaxID=262668 RepID=UPI003009900D
MKLKCVRFTNNGFRKLVNVEIEISPRITVISGHNGIGKSTILGLIANGSEGKRHKSLFGRTFRSVFSEIFFLDYSNDFKKIDNQYEAFLDYKLGEKILTKKCSVEGNQKTKIDKEKSIKKFMVEVPKSEVEKVKELDPDEKYIYRLRVIPRTISESLEFGRENGIGKDAKVNIPTLYLGMSRITPIGEFSWDDIDLIDSQPDQEDIDFINSIFDSILPFKNKTNSIYTHDFSNSNKGSKVPDLGHPSLSISLGQDSISSIVTALASFNQLKNKIGSEYTGGMLVIDEIEAGLHPHAQKRLIEQLKVLGNKLNLQIIVTSHSLTVIKTILDHKDFLEYKKDSVVYLMDTNIPRTMKNVSYSKIKNDMLLVPYTTDVQEELPKCNVYFEDLEAHDFMTSLISSQDITDTYSQFGKELNLIPAKLGCDNLFALANSSQHFKESVLILDSDSIDDNPANKKNKLIKDSNNICILPPYDRNIYSGVGPDKLAYMYLFNKYECQSTNLEFWNNLTPEWFTTDYYHTHMMDLGSFAHGATLPAISTLLDIRIVNRKILKRWYMTHRDILDKIQLFKIYSKEFDIESKRFIESLSDVCGQL